MPLFIERVCVLADFPVLHIRTLRLFQHQLLNWLYLSSNEKGGRGVSFLISHTSRTRPLQGVELLKERTRKEKLFLEFDDFRSYFEIFVWHYEGTKRKI